MSNSSCNCYESGNIKFLVWVYENTENNDGLLKLSLLRAMETTNETDRERSTRAGRPSKLRNALRVVCRIRLKAITPNKPKTQLVELGALSFTIFTCFLVTYKKRVQNRQLRWEGKAATVMISMCSWAFELACSSLNQFYREEGLDKEVVSKDLLGQLSTYTKGSRRAGSKERKKVGLSTVERTTHLPLGAYCLITKIIFESNLPEHLYVHIFFIMD